MPITIHPMPIGPDDYISQEINPMGGEVVAIVIPHDWEGPAPLSFYAGPDDGNLAKQLHDANGQLIQIPVVPDTTIQMPPGLIRGHFYLSIVSGTEANQVSQTAKRLLHAVVRT